MIVFYLMTEKGYVTLQNFVEAYGTEKITYVCSARDAQMETDYFDRIGQLCSTHGIAFFARGEEPARAAETYAFTIGWRWLLPSSANLIIFHDSLLPAYRGFAPLVNALINGEERLGVTAIFAADEYDKGDIVAQEAIDIAYPMTIQQAIEKIAPLYSKLVNSISAAIIGGKGVAGTPQRESEATYSLWRDAEDYCIDLHKDADRIKREVDALGSPYDGAKLSLNGEMITLVSVEVCSDVAIEDRDSHIGKVIFYAEGYPVVVCKRGLLRILDARKSRTGESVLPLKQFRSRFEKVDRPL
ncbi:methionyl-tRNA formyltransferase [Thiomicrolovo sp. ZZH C-3]